MYSSYKKKLQNKYIRKKNKDKDSDNDSDSNSDSDSDSDNNKNVILKKNHIYFYSKVTQKSCLHP